MEVPVKQTILVVDILCVLIVLLIAFFTYRQGTLFTSPWSLLLLVPVAYVAVTRSWKRNYLGS